MSHDVRVNVTSTSQEFAVATARGAQAGIEAAMRVVAGFQCPNGCADCPFKYARDAIIDAIRKIRIEVAGGPGDN